MSAPIFDSRRDRARGWSLLLVILAGCTAYQPTLELWPASDASASTVSPSRSGMDAGSGSGASSGASSGSGFDIGGSRAGGTGSGAGSGSGSGGGSGSIDVEAGTPEAAGGGGSGAMSPPDASLGSSSGCTLSVTVRTLTDNGGYSPRNVGAIWIAQGSGTFVKTLARWAQSRVGELTLWNSATAAANLRRNVVDAVTSATLSSHQTHNVSWNCTDTNHAVVPDGAYRVYFEMTDDNQSGPNMFVPFTKGPNAATVSPPDATYFKGISLVFKP
ncbi:MAG: DUF2271 domain-containing protein [Myxococcota bacterium]|nr:DUF2271 domain-containing protein [Myxococcota bacterium]